MKYGVPGTGLWLNPLNECDACDALPEDETCPLHGVPDGCWQWLEEVAETHLYEPGRAVFSDGATWGAGWAFAIVGMAQAIRDTDAARKAETWANTGEHVAAIARAFDPDDPVGDDDVVVRGPPTARR